MLMVPPADVHRDYVKERLNARYVSGIASNNLTAAGVLIHALDGGVDAWRPWIATDRTYLSASLVHHRKWLLYSKPHGTWTGLYGAVKNGALVIHSKSRVICSYPQDSGSLSWTRAKTGVPGCGPRPCDANDKPYPLPGSFGQDRGYPCCAHVVARLELSLNSVMAAPHRHLVVRHVHYS